MPLAWSVLAAFQRSTPAPTQQPKAPITIEAPREDDDLLTGVTRFEGGVVARYGVTKVSSDRLEVNRAARRAVAEGNVLLVDPVGTARAKRIEFSWAPDQRTGTAYDVEAKIAGATIRAETAVIRPGLWTFNNAFGTNSSHRPPVIAVRTPKLTIQPGQRGHVDRPTVSLFGKKIVTLPSQSFTLDPRVRGLTIPTVAYRRGDGLGIGWASGFLLDHQTALDANAFIFPGSLPGYGAQITRTFVDADLSKQLITPVTEFAERFNRAYFENVNVRSPLSEYEYTRDPRNSVTVASLWNQGVAARLARRRYSKPLEISGERGGPFGSLAFLGHTRLQTIGQAGDATYARVTLDGSLVAPPRPVGKNLSTLMRADTNLFLGGQVFGWARGVAGLAYQPVPFFRVSGALVGSIDAGDAQLTIDRLYQRNGGIFRADLITGPTRFSYIVKYDTVRKAFDKEYIFTQAIDAFEFTLVSRQVPQDYHFGFNLRLNQFSQLVKRRKALQRSDENVPPPKTVISSPSRP